MRILFLGGDFSNSGGTERVASIIANEFAEAVTKLHTQSLIEIGLVLFVLTLILNMVARFLVWSVARKTPQEARA